MKIRAFIKLARGIWPTRQPTIHYFSTECTLLTLTFIKGIPWNQDLGLFTIYFLRSMVNKRSIREYSASSSWIPGHGSPLSPILFLFSNADLIQRQINSPGGVIAFVDDFTTWVTGPTERSNREGVQTFINEAHV